MQIAVTLKNSGLQQPFSNPSTYPEVMAIQWKEAAMRDRLLASVIAASSNLDMKEVARIFGIGATYDAVEGQLRKAKKLSKELTDEAKDRVSAPEAVSRAKKSKSASASPVKSPVKGARVAKAKKTSTPRVKTELLLDDSVDFGATIKNTGSDEEMEV
ncbi:hypothetical protein OPT61_g7872 [Boeremia exigua]|uniref:Uncharacterized protein n=1 Tax=Boeremia exigua TaxID=749465 RepID=A0ACC2I0W7_9PLEO|nr:hypothetical protein OPT61_g7872 [Boeremia exigua]